MSTIQKQTILIVDDVPENITSLGDLLGDIYEIRFALNGRNALAMAHDVDLVLLDIVMPGLNGYEVCRRLTTDDRTANVPVIFITAMDDAKDEAFGLTLGAVDYITKPFSGPIVEARVKTQLELKKKTDLLAKLAQYDGLTGVANRRRFDQVIETEWKRATRDRSWLSLIFLDIDHFKGYNDRYGHPAGDKCLKQVASCLEQASSRATDLVARYGGEEFAIILPGTDAAGACIVAGSIREVVNNCAIEYAESPIAAWLTVSIGVASVIPSSDFTLQDLIVFADESMYEAKSKGRNRIQCRTKQGVKNQSPAANRRAYSESLLTSLPA